MSEPGAEIPSTSIGTLSKVEQHQAFKSDRDTRKDVAEALSSTITAETNLYQELILNPYSPTSVKALSERFPDASTPDLVKAVVLAEPEAQYDNNFRQLPLDEQRKKLYEQIDTSAEMSLRLVQYFHEHAQEFWDLSHEQLYERLTAIAFGSSDLSEIELRYAQSQRRGFRLSIVNFIEDLQKLKPHKDEFEVDLLSKASSLLEIDLKGQVEVESLPIGFVIYLEEIDYAKMEVVYQSQEFSSRARVLFRQKLPPELRGRIVIINKGGEKRGFEDSDSIKQVRAHELRHILFAHFLAESETLYILDTRTVLSEPYSFDNLMSYADQLLKSMLHYAKDEIIAYYGSGDLDYRKLSSLGGDKWFVHIEELRDYLWLQDEVPPEEKALISDEYQKCFADYLMQIREYQWIVQKLFQAAQQQSNTQGGLTTDKAEALLQNIPIEKSRRLAHYFGVRPSDIPQLHKLEQQEQVKKFSRAVDESVTMQLTAQSEEDKWSNWTEKIGWDNMDAIKTIYPLEALPAFLKIIEASNNEFFLEDSLYAIELILQMNQQRFSDKKLLGIRESLVSMLEKRRDPKFDSARSKADELLRLIDEVYQYGGVDFIHNQPLGAEVGRIMKTADGQQPSLEQIERLVEKLIDSGDDVWIKHFRRDYYDILNAPEAIPVLIQMGTRGVSALYVGIALEILDKNRKYFTPEQSRHALTMIELILTRAYQAADELLSEVRRLALKLKEEIEGDTF